MPLDALSDMTDDDVLALYSAGDARAAQVLTMRFAPKALGQATRLLGDASEAQDVAQDAMMRLFRQAPDWRRGEAKVGTWLYRVVANLCTDRLRKRGGGVALDEIAEPLDPSASVPDQMQASARAAALRAALAELPERQRLAVSLRHLEGLSNPQIADIMQVGVEAVESLVARGKRALASRLLDRKDALGFEND
ncbi:RNA polymerase sigma factor [Nereida sp. MMG024]|nr:RNA polymerase sigma factor [Nereida sp. MMG025]MCF6445106.1 RNA polymerase sigma factor [Nereida sp. MMG025]